MTKASRLFLIKVSQRSDCKAKTAGSASSNPGMSWKRQQAEKEMGSDDLAKLDKARKEAMAAFDLFNTNMNSMNTELHEVCMYMCMGGCGFMSVVWQWLWFCDCHLFR